MRKVSNRLFLLFVVLSFAFGAFLLTGCTSEESKNGLKLSFEEKEYVLEVGEQIEIAPVVTNAGEEQVNLVWKSYNSSVVLVNDGVLEGVSVGKTEVKVYVSGKQNVFATVTVKVTAKDNKPVATFNDVPEILYVGDELQLTHELANPENECEIVYQSLTDAATIDQTGLITVVEEGYGLVTVKATDKVTGQYVSYNFAFKVLTNYDIIYVLDGGINNEQNPSFYISDQKDIILKEPSKLGWKFLGWFEDEELTKPISVIDVDRKENITIYASWEAITYEIEYNVNGGSLPIDAKFEYQYCVGYELPVPIKLPTDKGPLEGYKFAGWYDNEKFEGQSITAISTTDEGNKTYYAKWVDTILIEVEEPVEGVAYKLGMYQKGLQKWLWMTGVLEGYYGSAVEKYYNAADVEVVKVNDGYNLKVVKTDGSVVYINAESSGDYNNIKFGTSPANVWTFDQTYNTFVATVANGKVYMGTYTNTSKNEEHDTFGLSLILYAENSTSYVAHLYEEIEYTDEVKANNIIKTIVVESAISEEYELPLIENVTWTLKEDYDFAEINDAVISVVQQKEDKYIEVIATVKYNEVTVSKTFTIKIPKKIDLSIKNVELNASKLSLTSTYKDGQVEISDIQFKYSQLCYQNSGIQTRTKNGVSSKIWNQTEMREIQEIVITLFQANYSEEGLVIKFGNDVNCSEYSVTLSLTTGLLEYVITPDLLTYKYFAIEHSSKHTVFIDSINVVFELTEEDYAKKAFSKINLDEDKVIAIDKNYELPKVADISWSLNGTYDAAELNDNIIEITRQKEDVDIEVKAQYKDTEFVKIYKFKVQKETTGGISYVEKTYTYTFTAKQYNSNNQSKTLNGVSWKASGTGGNYWGYDGTKGQQFGSGSYPYTEFNLQSASFNNVTKIVINTSGAKDINAKLKVYVGTTQIGNQISLTKTATSYTFTASEMITGTVKLAYTQTSKKAIYIKSITITYNEVVQN